MNSLDEIKKLAIDSSLVTNPKVSFLAEGYGNLNYLLEEGDKKLVLRLKKSDEGQFKDSLEREYVFLRYLESKGIYFCPKALFHNKNVNFIIESFLEGKKVLQSDFSDEQIDLLAKQLNELNSLDTYDFSYFCEKYNLQPFQSDHPLESLEKYGLNRFKEAKKGNLPQFIIDWIEKRLDLNLAYLNQQRKTLKHLGISWGDVQWNVIINASGGMYFYDFEHSGITSSSDITYVKIHGKFNPSQLDHFLNRYAHYSGKTRKELDREIEGEERIIRVNDVIWAAMKWTKTGDDKFKDLTEKRIQLVENIN